jgi:hypothetical protein
MAVVHLAPTANRRLRRMHQQRRTVAPPTRPGSPLSARRGSAANDGLVAPGVPSVAAPGPAPSGGDSKTQPLLTPQEAVVLELFGRAPVAFHRVFVDLAGSVTAALWLSHVIGLATQAGDDMVQMSQEDCFEATGLSRREQETARARLRAAGLVAEERQGRLVGYRVDFQAIASRLLTCCSQRRHSALTEPGTAASSAATGTTGA